MVIRLRKSLYEACRINKWWASELSIQENHVHLIIQTKPGSEHRVEFRLSNQEVEIFLRQFKTF
jgi:REP element-mobilizing transposase RayT